ncbi:MAG: hypothetical protein AAF798_02825 [Bacteroidota bacterium]
MKKNDERKALNDRVWQELLLFKKTDYHAAINEHLFTLVDQRFSGNPLRAFFVDQMYAYLKENKAIRKGKRLPKAIFHTKLPFIFELIISIQYLHNQVLDQKAGVQTTTAINANLLNANLLKDLLYQYIDQSFDAKTAKIIRRYVLKTFQVVDLGQCIEKEWNTYDCFIHNNDIPAHPLPEPIEQLIEIDRLEPFLRLLERSIPKNRWDYTALYLKRIYLTCASLFVLATKLLIELTGASERIGQQAIQFSVCYGMMRQIINDNADVIPSQLELTTRSKLSEDAFSDVKNKNITLPVLLHLVEQPHCTAFSHALQLGHQAWEPQQEPVLFDTLVESHALFKSIQFSKVLAAMCEQALSGQGKSKAHLLATCSIVHWNKFLYPCLKNSAYKKFKKTSFYKHIKRHIAQLNSNQQLVNAPHQEVAWSFSFFKKIPAFFYHKNSI